MGGKMAQVTKRQKSVIDDIKLKLNITYKSGNNRDRASNFIRNNIQELRNINQEMNIENYLTGKQARYIKRIEEALNIKFNGKTFDEAWDFIDRYKSRFDLSKVEIYI